MKRFAVLLILAIASLGLVGFELEPGTRLVSLGCSDTSSGTASASDILAGKIAWVDGDELTGTGIIALGDAATTDVLAGKDFSNATSAGLTGTRPACVVPTTGIASDAGEPWPVPRFTDNTDGTTTDNLTGLMWCSTLPIDETLRNYDDSLAYAAASTLASHSDWRLPTQNEAVGIVDWSKEVYGGVIVDAAFTNNMAGKYIYLSGQYSGTTTYRCRFENFLFQAVAKTGEINTIIVRGPDPL